MKTNSLLLRQLCCLIGLTLILAACDPHRGFKATKRNGSATFGNNGKAGARDTMTPEQREALKQKVVEDSVISILRSENQDPESAPERADQLRKELLESKSADSSIGAIDAILIENKKETEDKQNAVFFRVSYSEIDSPTNSSLSDMIFSAYVPKSALNGSEEIKVNVVNQLVRDAYILLLCRENCNEMQATLIINNAGRVDDQGNKVESVKAGFLFRRGTNNAGFYNLVMDTVKKSKGQGLVKSHAQYASANQKDVFTTANADKKAYERIQGLSVNVVRPEDQTIERTATVTVKGILTVNGRRQDVQAVGDIGWIDGLEGHIIDLKVMELVESDARELTDVGIKVKCSSACERIHLYTRVGGVEATFQLANDPENQMGRLKFVKSSYGLKKTRLYEDIVGEQGKTIAEKKSDVVSGSAATAAGEVLKSDSKDSNDSDESAEAESDDSVNQSEDGFVDVANDSDVTVDSEITTDVQQEDAQKELENDSIFQNVPQDL